VEGVTGFNPFGGSQHSSPRPVPCSLDRRFRQASWPFGAPSVEGNYHAFPFSGWVNLWL
jgi:phenylalanyl-tRNA synthetase alpha subunit